MVALTRANSALFDFQWTQPFDLVANGILEAR